MLFTQTGNSDAILRHIFVTVVTSSNTNSRAGTGQKLDRDDPCYVPNKFAVSCPARSSSGASDKPSDKAADKPADKSADKHAIFISDQYFSRSAKLSSGLRGAKSNFVLLWI